MKYQWQRLCFWKSVMEMLMDVENINLSDFIFKDLFCYVCKKRSKLVYE